MLVILLCKQVHHGGEKTFMHVPSLDFDDQFSFSLICRFSMTYNKSNFFYISSASTVSYKHILVINYF
jgi:hypothetical protein